MPVVLGVLWAGLRALFFGMIGWLVNNGGGIVANIMVGLGLYFLVAKPVNDSLQGFVQNQFNGAPGTVVETLYYLNVDNYATMILSAWGIHKTMQAGRVWVAHRNKAPAP